MIKKKNTNPLICVATAIIMVKMIDKMQTMDGIIRCFFFISLQCPAGVDKKQLPPMFSICPIEQRMAQATTSNQLNTNTKETMNDKSMPVMEHESQPIILVLYDRSPHRVFSFPKENILFSSLSLFPSSNAFPMQILISIFKKHYYINKSIDCLQSNETIKYFSFHIVIRLYRKKIVYNNLLDIRMEIESKISQFLKVDEEGYVCLSGPAQQKSIRLNANQKGSAILSKIINTLGERSAISQKLKQTITTSAKFNESDHRIYIKVQGNKALGFIKVGEKKLFYHDHVGNIKELTTTAVLDFYVHQTCQRNGIGKEIFQKFLKSQNKIAQKLAYDRPSSKLIGFLKKHYVLSGFIPQNNNYVIFDKFFGKNQKVKTQTTKENAIESKNQKLNLKNTKMTQDSVKKLKNQGRTFEMVGSFKGAKDQSKSSFGCPWAVEQKAEFKTSSNSYGHHYHNK